MQYDLWFDHVKHEFSVSIPVHLANVKTNIKIKTDTEYKMSKVMYCFGQSPYNICLISKLWEGPEVILNESSHQFSMMMIKWKLDLKEVEKTW